MFFHWSPSFNHSPHVSSTLLSIRPEYCSQMVSIFFSDFQFFQTFIQAFEDRSKGTDYNWYQLPFSSSKEVLDPWQSPKIHLIFHVLLFSIVGPPKQQSSLDVNSILLFFCTFAFFLLINTQFVSLVWMK